MTVDLAGALDGLRGLGLPRVLVLVASVGVPPLMWEMWYSHYRGNFHRWPMVIPMAYPPLFMAAGFLLLATTAPWALWTYGAFAAGLVLVGLLGFFFHLQGIARQTGGWNLDNVMVGPPSLAPLSFAGLGALGLLALAYWTG
jgi:hypothetical protein